MSLRKLLVTESSLGERDQPVLEAKVKNMEWKDNCIYFNVSCSEQSPYAGQGHDYHCVKECTLSGDKRHEIHDPMNFGDSDERRCPIYCRYYKNKNESHRASRIGVRRMNYSDERGETTEPDLEVKQYCPRCDAGTMVEELPSQFRCQHCFLGKAMRDPGTRYILTPPGITIYDDCLNDREVFKLFLLERSLS